MLARLDLARFRKVALNSEPFDYLIVPGFLPPKACDAINADYPNIANPGSFPLSQLAYGPEFDALMNELRGPEMRAAFAEKFHVDLEHKPTMITVRGRCGPKDGRVHVDSVTKIITVLIYVNTSWQSTGGRLRLLGSENINDVLTEVVPEAGTLVAFRRCENSWHGHLPFIGERRVLQLNWVTSRWVLRRETFRHSVSAFLKGISPKNWLMGSTENKAA